MKLIFLMAISVVAAQSSQKPEAQECPMHPAHAQMNERGQRGMGFSQTATTHHFFLNANGGAIQVEANGSAAAASRENIRMHLAHIAHAFQNGDFDIPMFVHDAVPPGVPEMRRRRKHIHYTVEQTANGGRVTISTTDNKALAAIHRFLRFQIEEHQTGDATEVR
jgi:hypothetical protein